MNINKRNYRLIIGVSFVRFFGDALFYAFLTRYFASFSFNSLQLGALIGAIPAMAVLGNIVLSKFATNLRKNRIILISWTLVEGTFIALSGFVNSFWLILLFVCLVCFCSNSYYNLLDTFIVYITGKTKKSYSSVRVFGTIAYIISTFLGGILIANITYKYSFLIGGCLMILSALVFLCIKFDLDDLTKSERDSKKKPVNFIELFKNKNYLYYLLIIVLLLGVHWVSDNIYNLYTNYLNISDKTFGYFTSGTMVVEALTLMVATRFRTFKSFRNMITIAAFCLILKLTIFAIPGLNNYVYLVTQLLRGVTFGLILAANLYFLTSIVEAKYVNKGFFIAVAAAELFSAVCSIFAPSLIEATSYTLVFIILAVFSSLSFVFIYLVKPLNAKHSKVKVD